MNSPPKTQVDIEREEIWLHHKFRTVTSCTCEVKENKNFGSALQTHSKEDLSFFNTSFIGCKKNFNNLIICSVG
jgi:hypothetical protein